MKFELSIREFIQASKRYLPIIIVFIIIGMVSSLGFTHYFVSERYSSQVQLIADIPQTEQSSLNGNEIVNNLRLVNTYKDFVKSDMVLEDTKKEYAEKYHKNISTESIKNSIEIMQSTDSQMFSIKVIATNAKEAAQIVNILAGVFLNKLEKVISTAKVTIISKGISSENPEFPQKRKILGVGALSGFFLGILVIFITVFFSAKIRDKEYISDHYNYVTLGEIGYVKETEKKELEEKRKELLGYHQGRRRRR